MATLSEREATRRFAIASALILLLTVTTAVAVVTCFIHPRGENECMSIERGVIGGTGESQMRTTLPPRQLSRPSLELSVPLTEERTLRLPTFNGNSSLSTVMNPLSQQPNGVQMPSGSSGTVKKGIGKPIDDW